MPALDPTVAIRPFRRILDLLATLRANLGDIDFGQLMELIGQIQEVAQLPDAEDSTEVRQWVIEVVTLARIPAGWTATPLDDQACELLADVIGSDDLWAWLYPLIRRALMGITEPDEDLPRLAAAPGIDPATIVMIVTAIIELIQLIRKLRQ